MPSHPWAVVLPVKPLGVAKSRLAPLPAHERAELALAIAVDTAQAALDCASVELVVVVTDDSTAARELAAIGAVVVPDVPAAGLNPALQHGAAEAAVRRPGCALAALSADLPALRPSELALALTVAAAHEQAFVADSAGTGTTMYAARELSGFAPSYGPGSRARHLAQGALELAVRGLDGLRHDVDTLEDLRAAAALGLGTRTAAVLGTLATFST